MTQSDSIKNALWLGVAKEKINPPLGEPLRGYPTGRPNTGIGLDLYARVAVFGNKADKPAAVLAVLDTIQVPAYVVSEMRHAVAKRIPGLNPKAIMIAATHTHSGAVPHYFGDLQRGGVTLGDNPRYKALLVKAVVKSIVEASGKMRQVTVRHGIAKAHLGHNRRVVVHGYAHNEWQDLEGKHAGYFNPDVNFICFHDAATGDLHAIIGGYGCHPVTLGGFSTKVSADYPGYFVAELEKATGAAMAMHLTTGAGNINPRSCLRNNPGEAKKMGKTLGRAVVAVLNRARRIALKPVVSRSVPLRFLLRANMVPSLRKIVTQRGTGNYFNTDVQAIHFGDLALVSAPGELFAEIATSVRDQSPIKHTIVVEHANDSASYIFTDAAALEGAYEVCRGSISENMERPYRAAALKALGQK